MNVIPASAYSCPPGQPSEFPVLRQSLSKSVQAFPAAYRISIHPRAGKRKRRPKPPIVEQNGLTLGSVKLPQILFARRSRTGGKKAAGDKRPSCSLYSQPVPVSVITGSAYSVLNSSSDDTAALQSQSGLLHHPQYCCFLLLWLCSSFSARRTEQGRN